MFIYTTMPRVHTGVIKHTKQTHGWIVKSARQRPEENSINPLTASIRLANREKKKRRKEGRRKKKTKQTNKPVGRRTG